MGWQKKSDTLRKAMDEDGATWTRDCRQRWGRFIRGRLRQDEKRRCRTMTTVAPGHLFAAGSVTIPGARRRFQWPLTARPSAVPTINGSFDVAGTEQANSATLCP